MPYCLTCSKLIIAVAMVKTATVRPITRADATSQFGSSQNVFRTPA
jgi:hypothetical protein